MKEGCYSKMGQDYIVNEEALENVIISYENELELTREYNKRRKETSRLLKEMLQNLNEDKKHLLYSLEDCINSNSLYFEKELCKQIIKDKNFIKSIID